MLVVAVVMILVVGPKDLPGMLRTIGKTVGNLRRMAGDFQRQFSDALKEADIDEVKNDLSKSTSFSNPLEDINKSVEELLSPVDLDDDLDLDDNLSVNKVGENSGEAGDVKPVGTSVAKKSGSKKPTKRAAANSRKAETIRKATPRKIAAKPKAVKTASPSKNSTSKNIAPNKTTAATAAKKPVGRGKSGGGKATIGSKSA